MRYLWDQDKNRRNVQLHGIAFGDAIHIFEGPTVDREEYERRIISAWRSQAHEKRYYWQNVEN